MTLLFAQVLLFHQSLSSPCNKHSSLHLPRAGLGDRSLGPDQLAHTGSLAAGLPALKKSEV